MSLGVGIIGAGMIARIHARAINRLDGMQLVGVMDNGRGKSQDIAPGTNPKGAGDLNVFLSRDDIDLVSIATPSGTHADIAELAAAHGKHVICEKPLDITSGAMDRMINACRDANVRLGGIFNTRYTEGAQLLKRAREQGRFGRLTFGQAFCPWWRDQAYYDSSGWKGTWAMDGGGALMNQGIHSVDLLQWTMGSPVIRISANIATLAHNNLEVEDTASASLQFANGALGIIAGTTSIWPGHYRTITLAGTDGTAVLADGNLLEWRFRDETEQDQLIRKRHGGLPGAGVGASDPSASVDSDGHLAAFSEFLDAIKDRRQPRVDGREAKKSVEIILAIYESARLGGQPVRPNLKS
ncbi:MAG: Gfo/Idh/MocA family protein [Burkholderiaceae bacterium]